MAGRARAARSLPQGKFLSLQCNPFRVEGYFALVYTANRINSGRACLLQRVGPTLRKTFVDSFINNSKKVLVHNSSSPPCSYYFCVTVREVKCLHFFPHLWHLISNLTTLQKMGFRIYIIMNCSTHTWADKQLKITFCTLCTQYAVQKFN